VAESWLTRLARWRFNWFPAFWGTGGRITYIAADWLEIRIRIPWNWRTRNYVGTVFGGSMFGALDGVHMVMLIKALGKGYEIWDKSGAIRFRKPAREPLYATVVITPEELATLRAEIDATGKVERQFVVDLVSSRGVVHATCEKLLSIRKRAAVARHVIADRGSR
jgi:acyl-coenzyme A thioesterase PaaI-like protein